MQNSGGGAVTDDAPTARGDGSLDSWVIGVIAGAAGVCVGGGLVLFVCIVRSRRQRAKERRAVATAAADDDAAMMSARADPADAVGEYGYGYGSVPNIGGDDVHTYGAIPVPSDVAVPGGAVTYQKTPIVGRYHQHQ